MTCGLAAALTMRFLLSGRLQDLDEANSLYSTALLWSSGDHDQLHSLAAHCAGLMMMFFHTGEAIDLLNVFEAIGHVSKIDPGMELYNQGTKLVKMYERLRNIDDLSTAISLMYASLSQRPPKHPRRCNTLNSLGGLLSFRFEEMGNRDDMDEAIAHYREAQKLTLVGHPLEFGLSYNIGAMLHQRFKYTGERRDLEDSITLLRKASEIKSDPDTLVCLGAALRRRNLPHDLEETISIHRAALDLTPPLHPRRYFTLQNLGFSLVRVTPFGAPLQDIEDAIQILREAVELAPIGINRRISLGHLAFALHSRYVATGEKNIEDLKEAIKLQQEVVNSLPVKHPVFSTYRNLSLHLMRLHSATNDPATLNAAMDAYRTASTCDAGSMLEQFSAAKIWANDADGCHPSALEAYSHAIALLPRIAALDTHLDARQTVLSRSEGLAGAAASCAIREGKLEKAVEFLESGRAVFWSQALRLRTPLDELERKAPALAKRLRSVSRELERGSFRVPSNADDTPWQLSVTMEQDTLSTHLRHLNQDWADGVNEARKLDGFENFLKLVSFATLKRAAILGPVVMITTSETGCDSLIVTSDGVRHVPLAFFTTKDAEILAQLLQISLSSLCPSFPPFVQEYLDGLKMRSQDRHGKPQPLSIGAKFSTEDCLRLILEQLWTLIVQPVVAALKLQVSTKCLEPTSNHLKSQSQKSESPRRLWWCPTGALTFLPIHAAGDYCTIYGEGLLDYAVSSYTSTLSGLLIPPPNNLCPLKMLVVIEPNSPGAISLPCTTAELQKIKSHVSNENLIELGTADSPSSIDKVLSCLSSVSMVHFACHGMQDLENPLESALLLSDGPMKISQIMEKSLVNASLAFLSACDTAAGDMTAPDESIHIAAAMLFAGYRGVVGTMWCVT